MARDDPLRADCSRFCRFDGYIPHRLGACVLCGASDWRQMTRPPQYSGPWARVRKSVLERDGYICQIRGKRCRVTATAVDHIVPPPLGPSFDPDNLRAACKACNSGRVNHTAIDRWRRSKTIVVLVIGPPYAPLYEYCLAHRSTDDQIIDFGMIARSLGYDPNHLNATTLNHTNEQRNAMLNAVRRGDLTSTRCWITSSNPNAVALFPHHTVVTVDGDEAAHNPDHLDDASRALVAEWYATRQGGSVGGGQASRTW